MSASGGLNLPRLSDGRVAESAAASFSVGSAWR